MYDTCTYSTCMICIFNKQVVIGHCEQLLSSWNCNLTSSRKLIVFWYNCNTRNYPHVNIIFICLIILSLESSKAIMIHFISFYPHPDPSPTVIVTHIWKVSLQIPRTSAPKVPFCENLTKCFEEAIPQLKKHDVLRDVKPSSPIFCHTTS